MRNLFNVIYYLIIKVNYKYNIKLSEKQEIHNSFWIYESKGDAKINIDQVLSEAKKP